MKKLNELILLFIFASVISIPLYAQERWNMDIVGSQRQWYYAYDVDIAGDFVYVATNTSGLSIVDISNPEEPIEINYIFDGDNVRGVEVSGDFAYLWVSGEGLHIVDISDPTDPLQVGFLQHQLTGEFCVDGDLVFVEIRVGNADYVVNVIDISDPENPEITGQVALQQFNHVSWCITAEDEYAYLSCYYIMENESEIFVIDATDPEQPEISDSAIIDGWSKDIAVEGDFVYIGQQPDGIVVVDVSDPEDIEIVTEVRCPRGSVLLLEVENSILYILADAGFSVMDFSDPLDAEQIASLQISHPHRSSWVEIVVQDDLVVVLNSTAGIFQVQFNDQDQLELISQYCLFGVTSRIALYGDYLYELLSVNLEVKIVDISDPEQPVLIGLFPITEFQWGLSGTDMKIFNGLLFATNCNEIRIFDLDDPEDPELISILELPGENGRSYTYLNIFGSLFCAKNSGVIYTIDITIPDDPMILDVFEIDNRSEDMAYSEGYLYLLNWSDLTVLDITDPEDISLERTLNLNGPNTEILISQNIIFLLSTEQLILFDNTEPGNPELIASFDEISGNKMDLNNEVLTVYKYEDGIRIYDFSDLEDPEEIARYLHEDEYRGLTNIVMDEPYVYHCTRNSLSIYEYGLLMPNMIHSPGIIAYSNIDGQVMQIPDTLSNTGAGDLEIAILELEWTGDEPGEEASVVLSDSILQTDQVGLISLDIPPNAFNVGDHIEGFILLGTNDPDVPTDTVFIQGEYLTIAQENPESTVPVEYELSNPFPNPFNSTIIIPFALPESRAVDIQLFDVLGRKLITLVQGDYKAGRYKTIWNGIDATGLPVSSGNYYIRMTVNNRFSNTKKVQLIR
ncbi:MAG: T9SS type A sorting domain-containing protein [Candidatus Electryonea clarkiae]|nr:T9SS type A sorting domain-containing protein [Candidatus Electryonea clarkiae]MDP8289310.1 T9SS type A sorting domain-containing protein [Candidatus Electryonea clarkiae]